MSSHEWEFLLLCVPRADLRDVESIDDAEDKFEAVCALDGMPYGGSGRARLNKADGRREWIWRSKQRHEGSRRGVGPISSVQESWICQNLNNMQDKEDNS